MHSLYTRSLYSHSLITFFLPFLLPILTPVSKNPHGLDSLVSKTQQKITDTNVSIDVSKSLDSSRTGGSKNHR